MRFIVRQPDGLETRVAVSNALVIPSVILVVIIGLWGWFSACNEAIQQSAREHSAPTQANPYSFKLCCQWETQYPADESNASRNRASIFMNWIETSATVAIAVFALLTWWVYRQIRDHGIDIERAYISMSHHPPGIDIDEKAVTGAGEEEFGGWHDVTFKFGIRNQGHTPAEITDIYVEHFVESSANIPSPPTGPGAGEYLFLWHGDQANDERKFKVKSSDLKELGSTRRLWMLGYVDYIDAFGNRRRAGYARYYDPTIDKESLYWDPETGHDMDRYRKRNNLPFVTQRGYNYDRPRVRGQGNDWNKQA